MRKEADVHAEEDKKKRELIEARNMADTLLYSTEKAIRDAGDKVSANDKKEIEAKIEELKKVKDSDDLTTLKTKTQELSQVAQKIGSAVYGTQTPQPGSAQTESQPGKKDDEAVEGEVEPDNKK